MCIYVCLGQKQILKYITRGEGSTLDKKSSKQLWTNKIEKEKFIASKSEKKNDK